MQYTHTMAVVALGIAIWVFGLPLNSQAKPKSKVFGAQRRISTLISDHHA